MHRRTFLQTGLGAAALGTVTLGKGALGTGTAWLARRSAPRETIARPPAASVIPVVGDGKWIWKEPPADQTGYLEPREYDVRIGIELEGTGTTHRVMATTPVPVELPEQEIVTATVEPRGCEARLRQIAPGAGQLILSAGPLVKGQVIGAVADLRLSLTKQCFGYARERFPAEQNFPKDFRKQYLYDSPGIQTRIEEVRELAKEVAGGIAHPWDKAHAFYRWVWENIEARIGRYTSVVAAVRDRVGDCEERAAVFVALCRVSGIPARLVWVPNHNWAEFCLQDEEGEPRWIPAHTSAYTWFGWTGAHEMVLQKGDRIEVPELRREERLLADWMRHAGSRPNVRYYGTLTPLPAEPAGDPGPGARTKDEKGEWAVTGHHELDPYLRDGRRIAKR